MLTATKIEQIGDATYYSVPGLHPTADPAVMSPCETVVVYGTPTEDELQSIILAQYERLNSPVAELAPAVTESLAVMPTTLLVDTAASKVLTQAGRTTTLVSKGTLG